MAISSITTHSLARGALPSAILFEERDELYWLRDQDLERAKEPLGLRCDGVSVGFDHVTWSAFVGELTKVGLAVALVRGNTVSTIRLHGAKKPCPPQSTPINLSPTQLLGVRELERLERRLAQRHSSLGELVSRMRAELVAGRGGALTDFGPLYVYEVGEEIWELDWDLTTVSPTTVDALALAAHLAGRALPCRLVLPKPRREKRVATPRPLAMSEPVLYGQLSLAF